jgi:hypothetical protein
MGYTTEFIGEVEVTPPLNASEVEYLQAFSRTRRMHRHSGPYTVQDDLPSDPQRSKWETEWDAKCGQRHTADVIEFNDPPPGQPGLWCQWVPDDDGLFIRWDEAEKFYYAAEWMAYLIDHFLKPGAVASTTGDPRFEGFTFDHVVNGTIDAQGEDPEDRWRLVVEDNGVRVVRAHFTWEEE